MARSTQRRRAYPLGDLDNLVRHQIFIIDVAKLSFALALLALGLALGFAFSRPTRHLLIDNDAHLSQHEAGKLWRRTLPGRLALSEGYLISNAGHLDCASHKIDLAHLEVLLISAGIAQHVIPGLGQLAQSELWIVSGMTLHLVVVVLSRLGVRPVEPDKLVGSGIVRVHQGGIGHPVQTEDTLPSGEDSAQPSCITSSVSNARYMGCPARVPASFRIWAFQGGHVVKLWARPVFFGNPPGMRPEPLRRGRPSGTIPSAMTTDTLGRESRWSVEACPRQPFSACIQGQVNRHA